MKICRFINLYYVRNNNTQMNNRLKSTAALWLLLITNISIGYGQSSSLNRFDFYKALADSTLTLVNHNIIYDATYTKLAYPNGDVSSDRGVCSDVVIRAYRKMGVDLQKEVHEDMKANFSLYPRLWGLKGTDRNIDHRRVPNLMTFFERKGTLLPITQNADDFVPGDIVCWRLSNGMTHIGIVVRHQTRDGRYHIVHNIGYGQVEEDCLFNFKIIGHYRYKR